MNGLIGFGILLLILWVVGFVVFKVAGLLIHLLVLVAIVMLVAGFIRRVTGRGTGV
jgi:hypothetical protein